MSDRRRRQYVPVSVYFAHGRTGSTLLNELGHAGLLAWLGMIAAAKRSEFQGTVRIVNEQDAWEKFGVALPEPPTFTLDAFLTLLGRLKQTRRRRVGDVIYVDLTHFSEWNDEPRLAADARRKSRSEALKTAEETTEDPPEERWTEGEGEGEGEGETPKAPLGKGGLAPLDNNGRPQRLSKRDLRKYTGCKMTRGTHGFGWQHNALGTDKPPPDWPHPKPSQAEVETALAAAADFVAHITDEADQ